MKRTISSMVCVLVLGLVVALPAVAQPANAAAAAACVSAPAASPAGTIDLAALLAVPANDVGAPTPSICTQCPNGGPCCSSRPPCVTWCQGLGADAGACLGGCCICLVVQ